MLRLCKSEAILHMAIRHVVRNRPLPLVIFYLFLQFQVAYLLDFPITLSLIGLPLFIGALVHFKLSNKTLLIGCLFIVVTIMNQLLSRNAENSIQFLRTFLLVLMTIFSMGWSISGKLKKNLDKKLDAMLVGLVILSGISITQAILGYKYGAFVTNPLGKFSYEYQYKADLNSVLTRASGFYSEPSFNALVCISYVPLVLSIQTPRKRAFYLLILAIYMISTLSLTGILTLGLILFLSVWDGRKIKIFPMISLLILLSLTINYVFQRIDTIHVEGSSANFRIVAPVKAILEILPMNLLGIQLGSLERTITKFGFLNGSKVGSSIDNGMLLLVLYFGLIAFGILGSIIFYTISVARKIYKSDLLGWPMALVPLLALNFNGGIFLPDFVCVISFMIVTIRMQLIRIEINEKAIRNVR